MPEPGSPEGLHAHPKHAPREARWDAALGHSNEPIVLPPAQMRDSLPRRPRRRRLRHFLARFAVLLLVAGALGGAGYIAFHHGKTATSGNITPTLTTPTPSRTGTASPSPSLTPEEAKQAALEVALGKALVLTSWPKLSPSLAALPKSGVTQAAKCAQVTSSNAKSCLFGATKATHHAVLIGDASALNYLPAILGAFSGKSWDVQVLTYAKCPVAAITVLSGKKPLAACTTHHSFVNAEVAKIKPAVVFLSDAPGTLNHTGNKGSAVAVVTAGLRAEVKKLRASSKHVVYLTAPPGGKDLTTCDTSTSKPTSCIQPLPGAWKRYLRIAKAAVLQGDGQFVDTSTQFCLNDRCPPIVGTTPVYVDGVNVTAAYSAQLAFAFDIYTKD